MHPSFFRPLRYAQACLVLIIFCVAAQGQKASSVQSSKPINLDKELEEKVAPDRAVSYYHFALAKWHEENGDLPKALAEMQIALKYNPNSASVHLEMAGLLDRSGNVAEAIEHAQAAARLDPKDPEPHWLLANIYFKTPERGSAAKESLQKAVGELEKLKELAPNEERVYFALGGAYFEMDEPEKAIEAYEKFQSLSPSIDNGYKEVAKYYHRTGNEEKAIEYLIKALKIQPDSPESLSMLSSLYLKLGKNKDAVPVYKRLLEVSGNNSAIGRDLAPLLIETGEYTDAINLLNGLIKAAPTDKSLPILLGRAQLGLRKLPEAIETFQSAVAADPNALDAKYFLGKAYLESGKYSEAANTMDDLLKVVPKDKAAQPLVLLGRAQIGLRKLPEAIATFQSLTEADPGDMESQFYLGGAYAELGKYADAIKIYSGLLEKIQANSEEDKSNRRLFQINLSDVYMKLGDYEKAIAILQDLAKNQPETAVELLDAYRVSRQFEKGMALGKPLYEKNPSDERISLYYASLLADAGKPREGAEILAKLLQANPKNINYYRSLSRIYVQEKRYSDAEKILRRAEEQITDAESMEAIRFERAIVYERQKDFSRAESLFKEMLQANPKNSAVLNYLGYMLADQGVRLEEALKYIKEALAIDPYSGAYLDSLGWAFFKMNDMENAGKFLLQASELVRNDATIDDHLGDYYFKTGNLQKANECWTKSVSLGTELEDVQKVRRKLEALQETLKRQRSTK